MNFNVSAGNGANPQWNSQSSSVFPRVDYSQYANQSGSTPDFDSGAVGTLDDNSEQSAAPTTPSGFNGGPAVTIAQILWGMVVEAVTPRNNPPMPTNPPTEVIVNK